MRGKSGKNNAGQKPEKQDRAKAEKTMQPVGLGPGTDPKTGAGALGPRAPAPGPWGQAPVFGPVPGPKPTGGIVFSTLALHCFSGFCPAWFLRLLARIVFPCACTVDGIN